MVFSFRQIVGRYFVEHMPNVYTPHATNISFFLLPSVRHYVMCNEWVKNSFLEFILIER